MLMFIVISGIVPAACGQEEFEDPFEKSEGPAIADPWGGVNRSIHAFNDWFYFHISKPIGLGWRKITPQLFRTGLDNCIVNLRSPQFFVNDLLQAKPREAGKVLIRFVINTATTLGTWDIAGAWGIRLRDEEDCDQTLGVWRIGFGPYFVIPFMGPASVRGVAGKAGDFALHPLNYIIFGLGAAVACLEAINDIADEPEKYEMRIHYMVDPYSGLRDTYITKELELINR